MGHRRPFRPLKMLRLWASGLGCVRGSRRVFSGLHWELSSGRALALVGPNGSGKSSLLRLVAGLLRAPEGRIELQGGDAERTIAEQAHYLGHVDALKPSLTVGENIVFWTRYLGDQTTQAGEALAAVGLGGLADLPGAYLSAGQRRRLSLARLISVPRPIWLLDEPTSALDVAGQERLAELMAARPGPRGVVLPPTPRAPGVCWGGVVAAMVRALPPLGGG